MLAFYQISLSLSLSLSILSKRYFLHIDNRKYEPSILEHLSRTRTRDRRKLQVSICISATTENPAKKNLVGLNRTSRPLGGDTRRSFPIPPPLSPSFDGRWTQTTIYSRASHTISISGPTHFPFLESRAAHFPDVPPVPAVKCQYGTYPRTKASLVRQHH